MSHEAPDMTLWTGRQKDGPDETLIHHSVEPLQLDELEPATGNTLAILAFCSDEGVKRNLGRPGAIDGPNAIRKALANLAVHWSQNNLKIYDAGNVLCLDQDLESAQAIFAEKVGLLKAKGYFPLLLGGGHEVSYPHFVGIKDENDIPGMINLDAHFDLRKYSDGSHSGSWARQIMDDLQKDGKNFNYLPIGINPAVNNREMFGLMQSAQQDVILIEEINNGISEPVQSRIKSFIENQSSICLTLDLDVISGAHAPGVSAPAAFGISPEVTWDLIELIFQSGQVVSMDIAEMSPAYDDGRTARLAAHLIWRVLNMLSADS